MWWWFTNKIPAKGACHVCVRHFSSIATMQNSRPSFSPDSSCFSPMSVPSFANFHQTVSIIVLCMEMCAWVRACNVFEAEMKCVRRSVYKISLLVIQLIKSPMNVIVSLSERKRDVAFLYTLYSYAQFKLYYPIDRYYR